MNKTDWVIVARLFHDTYEELALSFGYQTREDTKVFDPKSKNGRLMIEVCKAVCVPLLTHQRQEIIKQIEDMKASHTPNSHAGRVLRDLIFDLKLQVKKKEK